MRAVATQAGVRRRSTLSEKMAISAEIRAEEERQYKARYGKLLPFVQVLMRKGYVVDKRGESIRVGNMVKTPDQVKAMAERELRLDPKLGHVAAPVRSVRTAANGLKVGATVTIEKKKPAVAPVARDVAARREKKLSGAAAATTARSKEYSTTLGTRPLVVWLDLGLLIVDRKYQRDINQHGNAHINNIRRSFNWNCYQPIIVAERPDGKYGIIDGQHRFMAALTHPLIKELPCYVIDAPDVAQQAEVFVAVNSVRKSLTSQQKFFAALAAGKPGAVAFSRICADAGITILRAAPGRVLPPRSVLSPIVCQKLVERWGGQPVRRAIELLVAVHPETPGAFRGSTIAALTRIAWSDSGPIFAKLAKIIAGDGLDRIYTDAFKLARNGGVGSMIAATEKILRDRAKGEAP